MLAVGASFDARAIDPVPTPEPNTCLEDEVTGALSASPATVLLGESATLSWSVSYPSHCPVAVRLQDDDGRHPVASTGSRVVTPQGTNGSSWLLRAERDGVSRIVDVITIRAIPLPLPDGPEVRIEGSGLAWKDLFLRAARHGGKRIVLAENVDIDLTGAVYPIAIAPGTTITSDHARTAERPGPRLSVSDRPRPLMLVRCFEGQDPNVNVTFENFRLQGPHWGSVAGDDNTERAIMVESCRDVTIRGMELSGWSGQAVYVSDALNVINAPEDVVVTENFIHHNQHDDGNGYGVETNNGGRALIARNVFDFNRHAIMSGGYDGPGPGNGTGYVARDNLVLRGGGFHRRESWPHVTWQTHIFDVHGTEGCYELAVLGYPLAEFYHSGCGQAGAEFLYERNAIQYNRGVAIKLRGHPSIGAVVRDNVFAVDDDDATEQNSRGSSPFYNPVQVYANRYDTTTFGQYGVCDFDGDQVDDLFQATGVNWWYAPGGKSHWVFLKTANERLSDVGLGDVDGDRRCDVVAAGPGGQVHVSPRGRDDWRALTTIDGTPLQIDFAQLGFGDFNGDGRTDLFASANGEWRTISPSVGAVRGVHDWRVINTSVVPVSALRFGHFNTDRITDVVAVQSGRWAVSFGGVTAWTQLNRIRGDDLRPLYIGDIDGNGIDDMLRYRWQRNPSPIPGGVPGGDLGIWEVTWDGRGTNWIRLNTYTAPTNAFAPQSVPAVVGRFNGLSPARQLLTTANADRHGYVYDPISGQFQRFSQYPY